VATAIAATNGKEACFHNGWSEGMGEGVDLAPALLLGGGEDGLWVWGWCGAAVLGCWLQATPLSAEEVREGLLLSSVLKAFWTVCLYCMRLWPGV
jgi:hypothetical protein